MEVLKYPDEGLLKNRLEISNGSSDDQGKVKPIRRVIIKFQDRRVLACSPGKDQNLGSTKMNQPMLIKNHRSSSSSGMGSASCSVCGKSFGSKKAMFGHMRCHTERKISLSSSGISDGSKDARSGLTKEYSDNNQITTFLPSGSDSRKQRHSNNVHDRFLLSTDIDDQALDAVTTLLMLNHDDLSLSKKKESDEFGYYRKQVSDYISSDLLTTTRKRERDEKSAEADDVEIVHQVQEYSKKNRKIENQSQKKQWSIDPAITSRAVSINSMPQQDPDSISVDVVVAAAEAAKEGKQPLGFDLNETPDEGEFL